MNLWSRLVSMRFRLMIAYCFGENSVGYTHSFVEYRFGCRFLEECGG